MASKMNDCEDFGVPCIPLIFKTMFKNVLDMNFNLVRDIILLDRKYIKIDRWPQQAKILMQKQNQIHN